MMRITIMSSISVKPRSPDPRREAMRLISPLSDIDPLDPLDPLALWARLEIHGSSVGARVAAVDGRRTVSWGMSRVIRTDGAAPGNGRGPPANEGGRLRSEPPSPLSRCVLVVPSYQELSFATTVSAWFPVHGAPGGAMWARKV